MGMIYNLRSHLIRGRVIGVLLVILLPSIAVCAPIKGLDDLATPIKITLLLTLIPLIPFLLLTLTSFTRILVVFSLLRSALSVRSAPPNQILIGLALFMTFYIMQPTFQEIYTDAVIPYFNKDIKVEEAIKKGAKPLRQFMLKEVRDEDLALFVHLSEQSKPNNVSEVPTTTIIPAFIISELKIAFQIGFLIHLPFLVIDIVVASILLSMGMFMLPPMMMSVPLKLLLFVLVDGWNLIVGSLVRSF